MAVRNGRRRAVANQECVVAGGVLWCVGGRWCDGVGGLAVTGVRTLCTWCTGTCFGAVVVVVVVGGNVVVVVVVTTGFGLGFGFTVVVVDRGGGTDTDTGTAAVVVDADAPLWLDPPQPAATAAPSSTTLASLIVRLDDCSSLTDTVRRRPAIRGRAVWRAARGTVQRPRIACGQSDCKSLPRTRGL